MKKKLIVIGAVGAMVLSTSSMSMFAYSGMNGQDSTSQSVNELAPSARPCEYDHEGQRLGLQEGTGQRGGMKARETEGGGANRSNAQDGTGYGRGGEGKLQGPGGEGLHDGSCLDNAE